MTYSEQLYRDQLAGLQDAYEQSLFPRNGEAYFSTDYPAFSTDFEDEEGEKI